MKKITFITIASVAALSLTAFTFSQLSSGKASVCNGQESTKFEPPTFTYGLSADAPHSISKERMQNAKTVADLLPDHLLQEDLKNKITSVRDAKIRIEGERDYADNGNGNDLSKEQTALLRSMDYTSHFYLEGFITPHDPNKGLSNERNFSYYMVVVPEHQASYEGGNEAFVDYLKTNCQATIDKLQKGDLKSGSISFMVTKEGIISNFDLFSSCGYPSVDQKMLDLLNTLPHNWNVASNENGEKVEQKLVFSYGQMGC